MLLKNKNTYEPDKVSRVLIPLDQHGFSNYPSTISNRACYPQYISQAFDNRFQVESN